MFEDDAIGELNRRFYSVCPADYLDTRRSMLESLDAKTEVGASQPDRDRFRVLESTVLAHHAFEALVRLYLAHATDSACPWVEVVSETSFRTFKSRVKRGIINQSVESLAAQAVPLVFLGSLDLTGQQRKLVRNTASFLRSFAKTWLDDAHLYNAAKHGLTVVPGRSSLAVGEASGPLRSFGRGTGIEFLEHGPWQDDVRQWSLRTVWSSADRTLIEVEIACMLIRSLWTVARRRFGVDGGSLTVVLPSVLPRELPRDTELGSATRMSWGVLQERRDPTRTAVD